MTSRTAAIQALDLHEEQGIGRAGWQRMMRSLEQGMRKDGAEVIGLEVVRGGRSAEQIVASLELVYPEFLEDLYERVAALSLALESIKIESSIYDLTFVGEGVLHIGTKLGTTEVAQCTFVDRTIDSEDVNYTDCSFLRGRLAGSIGGNLDACSVDCTTIAGDYGFEECVVRDVTSSGSYKLRFQESEITRSRLDGLVWLKSLFCTIGECTASGVDDASIIDSKIKEASLQFGEVRLLRSAFERISDQSLNSEYKDSAGEYLEFEGVKLVLESGTFDHVHVKRGDVVLRNANIRLYQQDAGTLRVPSGDPPPGWRMGSRGIYRPSR